MDSAKALHLATERILGHAKTCRKCGPYLQKLAAEELQWPDIEDVETFMCPIIKAFYYEYGLDEQGKNSG